MNKYRVIDFGHRWMNVMGHKILMPQGSIVEQWDETEQKWIYVDCMHPDSAEQYKRPDPYAPHSKSNHRTAYSEALANVHALFDPRGSKKSGKASGRAS